MGFFNKINKYGTVDTFKTLPPPDPSTAFAISFSNQFTEAINRWCNERPVVPPTECLCERCQRASRAGRRYMTGVCTVGCQWTSPSRQYLAAWRPAPAAAAGRWDGRCWVERPYHRHCTYAIVIRRMNTCPTTLSLTIPTADNLHRRSWDFGNWGR